MKKTESECPITKVAELLSDSWTMRIMHALLTGPKRFCELERELPGISTRTLTNKLKRLSEEKLACKGEDGYYEATERGKGLRLIESAMRKYEKQYL